MSDGEILDHFPMSTFVSQREWSVTSLVDCTCTCTSVLSDAAIDVPLYTNAYLMMLVHKVLNNVQVAISTCLREWSVTSLVDCTCTHQLFKVSPDHQSMHV